MQRSVGVIAGVGTFGAIRRVTMGSPFAVGFGPSSLLLAAVVAAFVGLAVATTTEVIATRWVMPVRRARAKAESALWAYDATQGRRW